MISFTINNDYSITLHSNNALVSATNIRIMLKNEKQESKEEDKKSDKKHEVVNTAAK